MSYFSSLLRQTGLPSPGRSAPRTRTQGLEVDEVQVAPPRASTPIHKVAAVAASVSGDAPAPRAIGAPEPATVHPTIRIADPAGEWREPSGLRKPDGSRHFLPKEVEEQPAQLSPMEVVAMQVAVQEPVESTPRRSPEKAPTEAPRPVIDEIVTIPQEEARPIYLTDVREWVAATPVRKEEPKATPEPEVIRSRPRVREKLQETEETYSENVTLSIGTIHVTVEGPAAPVAQSAPPRPAAAAPRESPFDATRLTRSFVTF